MSRSSCALVLVLLACRPRAEVAPVPVLDAVARTQAPTENGPPCPDPTASAPEPPSELVERLYEKTEVRIAMRDGVRLFTAIYAPRDRSRAHAILLNRTPYGVGPYGADQYRDGVGPSEQLMRDGYFFVYQDVRGRMMSEGEFVDMRPHGSQGPDGRRVDESTDTWDTIDWLVKNLPGNSGKVGMWGISYPGFYAAAGMIDAHPALAAVSPQAPIADWWFDDFHHHGALFLPHAFNFLASFGLPRPAPTAEKNPRFSHGTFDGYDFFLRLGSLKNVDAVHYKGKVSFWRDIVAHPNYDAFWKARDLLPHLSKVAPAVMTVGGWYDAEDLYGPLKIYRSIEAKNPGIFNMLVMGPWRHGGWARSPGTHLGNVAFGSPTSEHYRAEVERRFFRRFVDGEAGPDLPEAYVFETGKNRWRTFDAWPPEDVTEHRFYVGPGGTLDLDAAPHTTGADAWLSDPARPVPSTEAVSTAMTVEYMTDDQRFAARRPDVVTYRTEPLTEELTLAGPVLAELWVSTTRDDADFVVKLVDVHPDDHADHEHLAPGMHMSGYQMMVRSEVIRGRFRDGYDRPRRFVPGKPTRVSLELQDVLHTFARGHRVMVQIQSTWFPLVDRNPQKWVDNVFEARDEDFVAATHKIHRSPRHPTALRVGVLPPLTARDR